jgi:hypothetical protein
MLKQSTRLYMAIFAGVALVVALSVPAYAHHGWGGNSDQETELTGTLEAPVSLAGPHATMKLRVDGQVWDITLAPSARTDRAGLKEGIIPLGATVTVLGHRNKTASRFEMKTEKVTWGDRVFTVYPDLH